MDEVLIDGSFGEGGGQILRSSLSLSAVLGRPFRIVNIRARRRNPGLQQQHLTAVLALKELTGAEVEGAYKGSTELSFRPGTVKCGSFTFDIGTAGSTSLVIQALLPALALSRCGSRVVIRGGTDVPMAPPIDYVRFVMLPVLSKLGVDADVVLVRRGHYPRGGGEVVLTVRPTDGLRAVVLAGFGKLVEVRGLSHAVRLPRHVAERQAQAAERNLKGLGVPIGISVESHPPDRDPHRGPGSGIVLWALSDQGNVIGADSLGERGKPAEAVGEEAARRLVEELGPGCAVDSHMGDMLIPYIALAHGRSTICVSRLTTHAATNIYVVERFLGVKFQVEGGVSAPATISVEGIGYVQRPG